MGSIIAISDEQGNIVQRYTYSAYGRILSVQDPNFSQPYRYTGREYDTESGLYYYRARYYDSMIGRFLSKDPIGLLGGFNTYAYVGGNPLNFIDPFGLDAIVTIGPELPGYAPTTVTDGLLKGLIIDPLAPNEVRIPGLEGDIDINFDLKDGSVKAEWNCPF